MPKRHLITPKRVIWGISFLIYIILIISAGIIYYNYEKKQDFLERALSLESISRLKIDQINKWREECISDASRIVNHPTFRKSVTEWLKNPLDKNIKNNLREIMEFDKEGKKYIDLIVLTADAKNILSLVDEHNILNEFDQKLLSEIPADNQYRITDFYKCENNTIHVDTISGICNDSKKSIAYLILRSNVSEYLYPIIETWPGTSKTAETLLVRKEGNDVLFLNNLRHQKNTALSFRIPLTRSDIPANKAVSGFQGIFEGVDYREKSVISYLQKVPGSNWYMVTKVDKSEVLSELYYRAVVICLFVFLLILLAGFATAFIYRQGQAYVYRELYNSEKIQRQIQEEFKTILYSIGDGVITTDNNERIKQMNAIAEKLTGWKEKEAIGHPIEEILNIVNEDTKLPDKDLIQSIMNEKKTKLFIQNPLLISKEKNEYPIAISGAPVKDEKGNVNGAVLVFRDQTEERESRINLLRSEDKYRNYVRNSPYGVFIVDNNGRCVEINPAGCKITGYSENEIINMTIKELVDPEFLETGLNHFREVCEKGQAYCEVIYRHKSGEKRWWGVSAVKLSDSRMLGFSEDITDRKNAESVIKKSEEKYRTLFENAPIGIFTTTSSGKSISVNPTLARMLGFATPEQTQNYYTNLAEQLYLKKERRQEFISLLTTNGTVSNFEYEALRWDKKAIWLSMNARITNRNTDGTFTIEGFTIDITDRKHTEESLIKSEKQYRELFENMLSGYAYCKMLYDENGNPDDFIYLDVNKEFVKITGLTDVEGKRVTSAIPNIKQEIPEMFEIYNRVATTGIPEHFEINFTPLGKWISISVYCPQKDHFVTIFEDITERKVAEQEREGTVKLLQFLNSTTDSHDLIKTVLQFLKTWSGCEAVGIRLKDGDDYPYFETNGFSEEFVHLESKLCAYDLAGHIIRDDLGNPVLDCMCGNILQGRFDPKYSFFTKDGSFWSNGTTELLASTNPAERQSNTRNRCNGMGYESVALIPMRNDQTIIGLIQLNDKQKNRFTLSFIQFIERLAGSIAKALAEKLARKELAESKENLIFAQSIAHIGSWEVKFRNGGQIWTSSDELHRIYDVPPDQIIDLETRIDKVHPDDRDRVLNIWMEAIKGNPQSSWEQRIIVNEQIKWLQVRAKFIYDNNGKILKASGTNQDITERKIVEEERRKLEEQLLQAQKMEAVGRLAGGVAHDFNNMLNVIIGYCDLALNKTLPNETLYTYIKDINNAALRSADLTRQLLAFSRKQIVSPEIVCLNSRIQGMEKLLKRIIGEDIKLRFKLSLNIFDVKVDPAQIDQIIANLAVNSRDAMPKGGSLIFETDNYHLDEEDSLIHDNAVPGDYAMMAVSDTGHGMSKETQEHIFEPFYTTKGIGKGTGLGMATVYGIVKQNNGFISIYSEIDKGTIVKIFLPRHQTNEIPKPETLPVVEETLHKGTGTILVAEDQEDLRDLIKLQLQYLGYDVIEAADAGQAIELFKNNRDSIRLLITDVIMPGMNGKELSDAIRELNPEMKTLFMSGYTTEAIAIHGVTDENIQFIQKPFTQIMLAAKINKVLKE